MYNHYNVYYTCGMYSAVVFDVRSNHCATSISDMTDITQKLNTHRTSQIVSCSIATAQWSGVFDRVLDP